MIGWLIFFTIVSVHVVVGIKLIPKYFQRHFEHDQKVYGSVQTVDQSRKEAAGVALFNFCFWPWIEAYEFLSRNIINQMTAEERRQKELERAYAIVEEHREKQAVEERLKEIKRREEFDRQLKGEE